MLTSTGFTLFEMHIVNFIFSILVEYDGKKMKNKNLWQFSYVTYIPNEWTSQELGKPLAPPWGPLLW
jgi:hypothetical protein